MNTKFFKRQKEEKIAEIYEDEWENYLRVQFENGKSEKEYTRGELEKLLRRKGWGLRTEELATSGSKRYIVDLKTMRFCGECEANPMYDSKEGQWYCPRCEG